MSSFRVNRTRGTFGNSTVMWGVFDNLGQSVVSGDDISVTFGTLTFLEDESYQLIEFDIIDDVEPELMELFEFQLLNVNLGLLATSGTVASVTIIENDDPYGAYEFEVSSRDVEIPEDIPVGGSALVNLNVSRNQGTFGNVMVSSVSSILYPYYGCISLQVVWEIFLESGAMLPMFTDLLLASTTTSLTELTGRRNTNTTAYQFDGSNSENDTIISCLTIDTTIIGSAVVMDFYTPSVVGSFSVSMWIMPTTPGHLINKRTPDGRLTPFGLLLIFDSGSYQIQFEYSYQTAPTVCILNIAVWS